MTQGSLGSNLWGPPPQSVAEDFDVFSKKYPAEEFRRIAELIASDEANKPVGPTKLSETILEKVRNGSPASFIRVSDGEGNLLGLDPKFGVPEELAMWCAERISYIHFGEHSVVREAKDFFRDMMRDAILQCDIFGVPELHRIDEMFKVPEPDVDVRAVTGNRLGALLCEEYVKDPAYRGKNIASAWFNRQLLPHYAEIIGSAESVITVSTYDSLPEKLSSAFGIERSRIDWIGVPTQAVFVPTKERQDTRHYPDGMERILTEIRSLNRQSLVLVAAGLLGKHYCTVAKECGHIAIDIGSIPEIWLGIEARGLSPDYIERWKL
ncbi:hypothetical protein NAP1_15503 [Erythrobacter sp. NAP1]|uniref:hypothetical protein n=1 Tax=Erythrobacter sp. NAP1 TaxID=237727 RepID=UPI000068759D|nr:hypothetical protein [Erythrobacter sp. NAP1]EAQ29018.1 hypothetical protein NAP1_15503 [Erythrobacter sp. NAP1]